MVVIPLPRTITDKDLPDTDGKPVENSFEGPQSQMLLTAIRPILDRMYGTGNFVLAASLGIYWELTKPPLDGCKAPDLLFIPDVSATNPDGSYRHSYLLWNEHVPPSLVMEYVSGDGSDEHDRTPRTGKYWVYERAIRASVYVIFDPEHGDTLEVYERRHDRFQLMQPNSRGHYELPRLDAELGLWEGPYSGLTTRTWMRFYDSRGRLLPNDEDMLERANREHQRANNEKARADEEKARADALAARLEALEKQLQERPANEPNKGD